MGVNGDLGEEGTGLMGDRMDWKEKGKTHPLILSPSHLSSTPEKGRHGMKSAGKGKIPFPQLQKQSINAFRGFGIFGQGRWGRGYACPFPLPPSLPA